MIETDQVWCTASDPETNNIGIGNRFTATSQIFQGESTAIDGGYDDYAKLFDRLSSQHAVISGQTWNLTVDFGSSKAINLAAIINTNLTSSASVNFYADDNNLGGSWGGADVVETIDASDVKNFHRNLYVLFTEVSKRYARLEITDPTNTSDLYMGEFIVGLAEDTPKYFNVPMVERSEYAVDRLQTEATGNDVRYFKDISRIMQLRAVHQLNSENERFREVFDYVSRNDDTILLIPATGKNRAYFGRIDTAHSWRRQPGDQYSLDELPFMLMSEGLSVTP